MRPRAPALRGVPAKMSDVSQTDVTDAAGADCLHRHEPDALAGNELVLCTSGELFGGVERHVLDLCELAQRRTGVYPRLAVFYDGELALRARAEGVPTVVLRGRHRYDLRLRGQLARLVSSMGIRVLHAHGYKATIVCALAKRRLARTGGPGYRRPVTLIKTEHGLLEPAATPLEWAKMHANSALDLFATRLAADGVCYVTADLERHYAFVHQGLRREVIHNGIEPIHRNAFSRPGDLEPGVFHLGIVGRLTAVKGIATAVRAMRVLRLTHSVRLNVIGSGPCELSLRDLVADLGLQDRVRLLGFKPNIHDYMAHLDALLMPSLHEGLPYTLLEAMSLGLPIIASRVGGLPEVLQDGRNGILLPACEPERLSAAIADVVTRPEWARTLGTNAAADQRRAYALKTMGDAYWRTYETIAHEGTGDVH
jgi:glycosyltransferase involved in cell wall biosynthesis